MEQGSRLALVVHARDEVRRQLAQIVESFGFIVRQEGSFREGLNALDPHLELLVAHVQLHEYNGLHLVLRAQTRSPDAAFIVLSDSDDRVLRKEAEGLAAAFVADSGDHAALRARLRQMLRTDRPSNGGRRTPRIVRPRQ